MQSVTSNNTDGWLSTQFTNTRS